MDNLIMLAMLLIVVFIYFKNNPLKHPRNYRIRCFLNWFPLGMTYAFLYMGRYNLTISKNALGDLMTKEDFGIIFFWGTLVYAFSFLINGPLTDKIGGKKAMLIGAMGSCLMNLLMGVTTYALLVNNVAMNLTLLFSVIYAANMYFQSFGAVAIVKVNAHWFHVKERGVFGGIFGTLISLGIYFAFDWGYAIVQATRANPGELSYLQNIFRTLVGATDSTIDQTWWVFFIPAIMLFIFWVIDIFLVFDSPAKAGLKDIETADASQGDMDKEFKALELIKKILTNPILITVALIEFCSGVLRNGIMHWYRFFVSEELIKDLSMPMTSADLFVFKHWGLLLCFAGIFGGFFAGTVSDKLFQSRRGPSVAMMYLAMLVGAVVMYFALTTSSYITLGWTAIFMSLCVIGVHGLLSGTATMDFAGRKGAATAVGMIDGFVYLGTAVQSISLGMITTRNWNMWPLFLIPFAIIGTMLALKIWRAFPNAKRKGAKK